MDNIGSVFAGVRHEIGNPVNSVNMILGILRAKLDTLPLETVRDYLEQMTGQIGRVEYILRSLKSFNLFETQISQNVDIGSFMENFLPLVRDDLEKKGIALETAVDPGVMVNADPRALQQVLLNIFTNASDAVNGSRRPKITTTVTRSGGAVHVRVQDNGMGIPPEKMKEIFKPFYTTKPHGTGLGLVIVKKMLARMNGTIDIESSVDAGTGVDIVIPGGTDERS
jgi:C4-dicarboxylate-specific signal transduction histidine kinase